MRGELDALESALADAPRLVLVEGAAGVGKTALAEHFLARHPELRVLRAAGEPGERLIAFGVADQLLRRAGLPGAGEDAGARLLDLLVSEAPLAVLVDDADAADAESLAALVFAVRRLGAARVLVIVAGRRGADLDAVRRVAGRALVLCPIGPEDLAALDPGLSPAAARRLLEHTGGDLRHTFALLADATPESGDRLPAPQDLTADTGRRLAACSPPARRLAEAACVLGTDCLLADAAALAGVRDGLAALDEAIAAGLLSSSRRRGLPTVTFAPPVLGAAVYASLRPGRAAKLHLAAAGAAEDEAVALRHRAAAAPGPDEHLAARFDELASRCEDRSGRAAALVVASRLSPERARREDRLLRAVDWMLLGGDLAQARGFAADVAACAPAARRDSVLARLAFTGDRVRDAERWLRSAWHRCDAAEDPRLAATIAHQTAFYALIHLRDEEAAAWSSRALELAPLDPLASEWTATLALSRWRQGERGEAHGLLRSALTGDVEKDAHLTGVNAWLRIAGDDIADARADLAGAAATELRLGAHEIGVVHLNVLARAHFEVGAWDEAAAVADQAVGLASTLQDVSARVFVWWAAALVPAARGDWEAADALVRRAAAEPTDAPDRVVAVSIAGALVAAGRGRAEGVIEALDPLTRITPSAAVDEPGFWPWQHLYAGALISVARLDDADAFLARHEPLAARRGHRTASARLAVARGRLEAARGDHTAAEAAFASALDQLESLGRPFDLALAQLALGQYLRREGRRRAAAGLLTSAAETFTALGARPALERTERELVASGLRPTRRGAAGTGELTPQELTVARLVVSGNSNREVATELQLSVKTVEVHLTRIYAKLGIASRTQLARRLPDGATQAKHRVPSS